MEGPIKERWRELCEQAAVEKDSDRLLALVQEINHILADKENLLKRNVTTDGHGV